IRPPPSSTLFPYTTLFRSQQAYYALRGGLTNEFYRLPNLRQNTIMVRYQPEQRAGPLDLGSLYITGADGRQVPLKSVADIERRRSEEHTSELQSPYDLVCR